MGQYTLDMSQSDAAILAEFDTVLVQNIPVLSIVDDSGTKAVLWSGTGGNREGYAFYATPGTADDFDVVAKLRLPQTDSGLGTFRSSLGVRASSGGSNLTGYTLGKNETDTNDHYLNKYEAELLNAGTNLATDNDTGIPTSSYFWCRFNIVGGALKVKTWAGAREDEPGTWRFDYDDSAAEITTAGRVGLLVRARSVNPAYAYLAELYVGTNGDSAPTGGGSEYTITGDITHSVTPAASGMQFNQNPALSGASGIAITPAATLLKNQNPTLAGDVSVTITPTASALVFNQNHALVGDSGFALTPIAAGLAYNQNHTIAGDSSISLTPAGTLQYNAVHAIVGDSGIDFAIAATLDYSSATSNTITGDVTVSVTPAAGLVFNQNPVLAGDSPITLGVAAGLVYSQGNAIVGYVTVALTPSATMAYNINRQYSGSSAVSLLPAAAMDYHVQQDYTLSGSLTLSLTPASVMSYTLSGDLVLGEVFTVPREIREFNVPKENRIFTVH